ncbi:CZB domain-containing protein [Hymenobacter terricola]|uniref:CZB domain-containing protein n=1 Tax=Hymenobacter terricola TaxID=2819236 RepID=UPI001B304A27|nr:CZB domain-containing protein [Hymenobacter terricola]
MTVEELKQDFESARIKHVHFKSKLRSFLFGNGGAEGPLRDPEQCGLGIWIAARLRGRGAYAHLPEARLFDRQHVLIHQEANRLMDLHLAGRTEAVSAGYAPLQAIADEMVALLQTMEARLRTQA